VIAKNGSNKQKNLHPYERIASVVGGLWLTGKGVRRGGLTGLLVAAGGGALLGRGFSGRSRLYRRLGTSTTRESYDRGIAVRRVVTIQLSPGDVYYRLRHLEAMPEMFDRLESVTAQEEGVSHWRFREGPLVLDCVLELTSDVPGERIAWRSRPESSIRCDGEINLIPAPGSRGTELHVDAVLAAPGGPMTMALAPVLRRLASKQLGSELRRMRQQLETGEIATRAMRPPGRPPRALPPRVPAQPPRISPPPAEVRR
jgi:uncharacterized membrane protein